MKGSPAKAAGTRGVTPGLPTGYTVYRHPGAPDEGKPGENSRDQSRNPWFTNNLHGIPAPGKGRKRRCSSHRYSGFRLMLCLPGRLRRPSTSPSRRRLPPCTIAVSASAGSRSTWASTTTRPRRLWAGSVRVDCGWVRLELARFRGHLSSWRGGGVHDAEVETAVPGGIPTADGRAGSVRTYTGRAGSGVRAVGRGDTKLGRAG